MLRQQVVKGNSVKYMPGAGPAVPERCPETGSGFLMGGPYWAEPIHDPAWLQGVLAAVKVRRQSLKQYCDAEITHSSVCVGCSVLT